MPTVVDSFYEDHVALSQLLARSQDLSLRVSVADNYRKALLLAAASFFEHRIASILERYARTVSRDDERLVSAFVAKAIKRQYHTYFDWESSNCNKFFSLFGPDFKARMAAAVGSDDALGAGAKAFLELGGLRNELVHQNFANFPLPKTAEEIYELFTKALMFVERVEGEFAVKG